MEAKAVEMSQVWSWFMEGWRLFAISPGKWIALTALSLIIAGVALVFIPGYGSVSVAFVVPAIYAGLLYGAGELDNGHGLQFEHLYRGFSEESKTVSFVMLGALTVAVYYVLLLITLITFRLAGGEIVSLRSLFGAGAGIKIQGGLLSMLWSLGFFYLVAIVALSMALLYACPSVMFTGVKPMAAVKSSFEACFKNVLPLLMFSAVWLVLGVIAAVPSGLGFLVLLPVTVCALYRSYRDIYGYGSDLVF